MKKIVIVLEWIIGIALACCLFLGGLGFIGFIFAFCIGGETAANVCTFLSKTYYSYLIKASTITVVLCFILQYLKRETKWVNPITNWKKSAHSRRNT